MYYETMTLVPETRTVVGIGANLGDRLATLRQATKLIVDLARVKLLACSSIWETDPVGGPPQPNYYNAAVAILSGLQPLELLEALFEIETRFGRVRSVRNAPRTLDLDLLWIEGMRVDVPKLRVPHPRLHERAFALAPMLEVVPNATEPISGASYQQIFAHLGPNGIHRLRAPLDASTA